MPERAVAHPAAQAVALLNGEQFASMTAAELRSECGRLQQELQLRNSALDAASSGFLIVDMQRRGRPVVYTNRALAQRTGYSLEELIGMPSAALTPAAPNQARALQIRDAMQAGLELRIEFQTARKDGSLYWSGTSLAPVFDVNGRITHYVSISADISGRRKAELQSQRDRERLAAVVESALEGVIAVDGAGFITLFNPAAETMFGRQASEMLGKPLETLMPERFRAAHSAHLQRYAASGQSTRSMGARGSLVGLRASGEEFPLEASISRVNVGDEPILTVFLRDVSEQQRAELERTRLEAQLRLAQKLESVGQLAAGIAHEINTPIQYVGDSVQFLLTSRNDALVVMQAYRDGIAALENGAAITDVKASISAAEQAADLDFYRIEVPKAFERTVEGINRVATIVRAMKEFSHPDAVDHEEADINQALQTTLIVASSEYTYVAAVETQLQPLPLVSCNIGELNQVFLNLVVNAAHAIAEAGKDTATGRIVITSEIAGDHVKITVSDNGCGIPKKNLDKVYDPFFTTKEVGKGTGQGLAITRSIVVVKHRGTVDIDSEDGVGTTFTLRLPIAGNREQEAQ